VTFKELEVDGKEEGGKQPRSLKFRRVEGFMGESLVGLFGLIGLLGFKGENGSGGVEVLEVEGLDVEVEVECRVDEDAG
jgi:hypothetical protein